jgi:hypothetical protein
VFSDEDKGSNNRRRSVDVLKDFLSANMEKKEKAAEKRHKEKLDSANSLIEVLREVANK